MHFNINLVSLAIILWSGMLIISGSIWVLCAQVGKLADIIEAHARHSGPAPSEESTPPVARPHRVARTTIRRSAAAPARRSLRIVGADSRDPAA